LFEKDSDGAIRKHIFAGANRVCDIRTTNDGGIRTTNFYHSDHLGSSNVISGKDGKLVQYCEYTPYGTTARNVVIASPVGAKQSPVKHLFTGKELDATGLYFYGARYYDPEIGRFITADTIVQAPYDPQSLNRYSYCRNNPINYVDPTGHSWWTSIWKAFVGTFIGGLVTGIAVVLSGGTLAPAAPFIFGTISGLVTGALSGGVQGALIGAGLGFFSAGAAVYGGSLAVAGLIAAGAGYSYATGGWAGVGDFAAGLAGGFIGGTTGLAAGAKIGNAIKAMPSFASESRSVQATKENKASPSLKTDQTPRAVKIYREVESGRELQGALYDGKFYSAKQAQGGEKIFRIYGGRSLQRGDSWTPIDPYNTPNFSDIMGLPAGNSQGALIGGRLRPGVRYVEVPASPIGNNQGGGVEWLLDNPNKDVTTELITTWDFSR
ncbi:MAG: RHS repeat-associated core domain-containing protein, partial [Candidatus Omnitrophota bacterium]|nr:RHS repeat-associated core domain-containing protein [Candidatus Omnitrophota bacterium]